MNMRNAEKKITTKEYLRQYTNANRSINAKLDQISKLRALATKSTTALTKDKVSGCMEIDKVSEIVSKIVDMERQVDVEIDALQDIKESVIAVIYSVKDARLRELLERRYISDQKWEQIAFEMGYDIRWIYRMHGKALCRIQKHAMESQY